MNLPDKLNRKTVAAKFNKLNAKSWEYLFDHEKENGLLQCRTEGWGERVIWYSTKRVKKWLIDRGHYFPEDFEIQPRRQAGMWTSLMV